MPLTNGNMMRTGPWLPAAQQRPQLDAERLRRAAQQAQGPLAERRVRARRAGGPERLEAHVPGAHRDRVRVHLLEQPPVDVELVLLARPAQAAARAGTPSGRGRCPRAACVCAVAASSGNSTFASSRTSTPSSVRAGSARVPRSRSSSWRYSSCATRRPSSAAARGVEHHLAARAVDGEQAAGRDLARRVLEARDRRDAERARDDRGVVGRGADVGDDRQHAVPVELRGLRRREVAGHQHHRARAAARATARRSCRAGSAARGRSRRRGRCCARAGSCR